MQKLIESVKKITIEELMRANAEFPLFNSTHEGYAVLLEEVDEALVEASRLKILMGKLWLSVKQNHLIPSEINEIREASTLLAAESIQVSAMAQKFINSLDDK